MYSTYIRKKYFYIQYKFRQPLSIDQDWKNDAPSHNNLNKSPHPDFQITLTN